MTTSPPNTYRILVADDERPVLDAYKLVISDLNPVSEAATRIGTLEALLFGAPASDASAASAVPMYSHLLCSSGEAAVQAIRDSRPEDPPIPVAFIDVRMPPGIDGIEAAARIRALDPEINIVIVTAYSDSNPREIALRIPPLDKLFYISKPFQKMELQQFVLALTSKWKAERALRQLNQEVTQRLLDLEAAYAELEEARLRAEQANKTKSEFLANMSHELRTPLNAMIGFTDLMRNETFGPIENNRYRQYLDDINHSSAHLLRMINDLLDFAAIEAGKLHLHIDRVELDDVIQSVNSLVRLQADQAGIKLRQERLLTPVHLRADEHRLRQVLLNLLSNAIKFTPSGGRITVAASIDADGALLVSVTDTGIGMDKTDLGAALEPFGQVNRGFAKKYQGTGLGLTIAKNLTEMQGGSLSLASELGKGTEATLRFPSDRYHVESRPHLVATG